jgi:hypothetical protein
MNFLRLLETCQNQLVLAASLSTSWEPQQNSRDP